MVLLSRKYRGTRILIINTNITQFQCLNKVQLWLHSLAPKLYRGLPFQLLEHVASNVDVIHVVSGPIAGGIVSSRDYVDVRSFAKLDDGAILSLCSSEHPDMPASKKVIRSVKRHFGHEFASVVTCHK